MKVTACNQASDPRYTHHSQKSSVSTRQAAIYTSLTQCIKLQLKLLPNDPKYYVLSMCAVYLT